MVFHWLHEARTDLSRELTLPLFTTVLYASLAGMSYGLDLNYWSGLLGMPQFQHDFGVFDSALQTWKIPASWQSVGSGTPTAGIACGALLAGYLGNRWGRIRAFWTAAGIGLVGILIQATSVRSYWQLVGGRIVNALSMGIICNIIPIYQGEVAPASLRGSFVNTYQFMLLFGGLIAVIVNWAMNERTDQWAYRLIILLQFIIPLIMTIGGFILPESPRWLISQNRNQEALAVLQYLRRGHPPSLIEKEVSLISQSVSLQKSLHQTSSYTECFRGPNLRRTLIALGVQALQPTQGNSYMTTYSIVLFQTIGIGNEYQMLIYLYIVMLFADASAFIIADKIGRRPLMFVSSVCIAASLFCVGGLTGFAPQTEGVKKGTLAAIFFWYFIDAVGWAGCVWITCAEAPTTALRERTMTIATFGGFVVNLLIQYVSPYLQDQGYAGLGGKIGFVWGSFAIVAAVWVAFFLPEMSRRSLEELDELFEKRVSVWKFRKFRTEGVGAELTALEAGVKTAEDVEMHGAKVLVGVEVRPVESETDEYGKKKLEL